MNENSPGQDSGWGPIARGLLLHAFGSSPKRPSDGLTALRFLFAALLMAGVLIAFVCLYLVDGLTPVDDWVVPTCVGLALLSQVLPSLAQRRRPEASNEKQFLAWYRKNFFFSFVLCEFPYLLTFAVTLIEDRFLPVLIGLVGFVIGMISIAPGQRNLARLQERLRAAGSPVDPTQALMKSQPSGDGTIGG
jgi:hypothetical protein